VDETWTFARLQAKNDKEGRAEPMQGGKIEA
jgi:hypothetical protein